jgi:hypothetical protein
MLQPEVFFNFSIVFALMSCWKPSYSIPSIAFCKSSTSSFLIIGVLTALSSWAMMAF